MLSERPVLCVCDACVMCVQEYTNYHFDVAPAHLEGALDRLAQFFGDVSCGGGIAQEVKRCGGGTVAT